MTAAESVPAHVRRADIALVAAAACVDLSGRTIRAGMQWLVAGAAPGDEVRTLNRLRAALPLAALVLVAALAVAVTVGVLLSPAVGAVLAVATVVVPVRASVVVRRRAAAVTALPAV